MRVMIIDDHLLFRECLINYLQTFSDIEIVGEAMTAKEVLIETQQLCPDVVLIDIDLASDDGVELAEQIVKTKTTRSVAILTAVDSERHMMRALDSGVDGYLTKCIMPDEFVTALRRLNTGKQVYPNEFLCRQLRCRSPRNYSDMNSDAITPRELQVLQCLSDGMTDKMIANTLEITESTVKNHMKNIRDKLHASNRVQATLRGMQLGLVEKGHS